MYAVNQMAADEYRIKHGQFARPGPLPIRLAKCPGQQRIFTPPVVRTSWYVKGNESGQNRQIEKERVGMADNTGKDHLLLKHLATHFVKRF